MKTFPVGLDVLLNSRNYVQADLYEFTLADGTVQRYTTADTDVAAVAGDMSVLHFDGANASTIITDDNPEHAWTVHGAAQLDTSQSKFGVSSLKAFSATNSYITGDGSSLYAMGRNDFTVDKWIRLNSLVPGGGAFNLFGTGNGPVNSGFEFYIDDSQHLSFYDDSNGFNLSGTTALTTGAWFHVATTRQNGVVRLFVNGTLQASGAVSTNFGVADSRPTIGTNPFVTSSEKFDGWIDEARVWKGAAAWTAAFTPPTAPYQFLYSSKGPYFDSFNSRSTAHWKAGLDVDTWRVTVAPLKTDPITGVAYPATIYGLPWIAQVRAGALDGATVRIHRAYWSAWPSPWSSPMTPQYLLTDLFVGRVAAVDFTRTEVIITINSLIDMLSRPVPREVYQAACRHTLFDTGCGLTRGAPWVNAGAVTGVTNNGVFQTNISAPDDWWALGMLTWTSGNNLNFSRSVRQSRQTGGTVTLIAAMPNAVQVGDTFNIYPGCDKTLTTCTNKFANAANFGGEPFIPAPETAV